MTFSAFVAREVTACRLDRVCFLWRGGNIYPPPPLTPESEANLKCRSQKGSLSFPLFNLIDVEEKFDFFFFLFFFSLWP